MHFNAECQFIALFVDCLTLFCDGSFMLSRCNVVLNLHIYFPFWKYNKVESRNYENSFSLVLPPSDFRPFFF